MNKKVVYILLAIFLVIIGLVTYYFIYKSNKTIEKFYLDDIYYGTNEFKKVDSITLNDTNGSYVVFAYTNFCQFSTPCEDVFKEYMEKYNISFISIPYEEFKNTNMHNTVQYAPSVIIVNNNKIVDYLSVDNDDDIDRYQDLKKFEKWINSYIYIEK